MDYFPAFLRLDGKRCLVVGGGDIATRKARLLLDAGAHLRVVAPQIGAGMANLAGRGRVRLERRKFLDSDVEKCWLVVSASGVPAVEKRVFAAANSAGVFCNAVDDKENCSYITPAIVDRSPIIVAISSSGSTPVLAKKIRARIESLLPAGIGQVAEFLGKWRKRVRQEISDLSTRLHFWERVAESRVAADIYDGKIDSANKTIVRMLGDYRDSAATVGEAWLVGAGPGDPDLLTLRALQKMQSADIILHDRLVSDEVLALARRDAEKISVGKTPGCRANSQEEINELLRSLVVAGKRVCRLKGGDPFIFGRGGEEAEALAAAGLPYEVVPGITAAAGCAAYAGIPLTHRDVSQSLVLVTAHGKNSVDRLDWPSLARERQTLAVYMAVSRFPDIMNNLIANGRSADTPIAIIERGTTAEQRIVRGTLGQLTMLGREHRIAAPAMLIIGEVASFGAAMTQSGQDPEARSGGGMRRQESQAISGR